MHKLHGLRLDVVHHHVADKLVGHLLKNFRSEHLRALLHVLLEFDELHDVASGRLSLRVAEGLVVGVKLLHHLELLLADTDDNHA